MLPQRQENIDHSNLKDTSSSVLMQHKNFSDAGELMLTALMLDDGLTGMNYDEACPME